MTWQEIFALKMMWGRIAPQEPNAFDARVAEAKWEIENIYHIKNFWRDDEPELYRVSDQMRNDEAIWRRDHA